MPGTVDQSSGIEISVVSVQFCEKGSVCGVLLAETNMPPDPAIKNVPVATNAVRHKSL
jgi:hypothetical protein